MRREAISCGSLSRSSAVMHSRVVFALVLLAVGVTVAVGKPTLDTPSEPQSSSKAVNLPDDVRFHLFTRSNPTLSYRLFVGDAAGLASSFFNKAHPTKIVVHGYTNSVDSPAIQDLKNAYMSYGPEYNVIGVDWSVLADGLYNRAKDNTFIVGEYVGSFIDFLVSQGVTYNSFHTVGHSLGGHVAGIAGHTAKGVISRATGMDPALPLFDNDTDANRLSSDDAAYVDVIHTDGGVLGFWAPLGHADFYPNGGKQPQPGCGLTDVTGSCSHSKSYEYYAASIQNPTGFGAHQCSTIEQAEAGSCGIVVAGQMGEGSSPTMRGLFHLEIRL